jgi:asparagine synthase (glutamine-hydrolysing)
MCGIAAYFSATEPVPEDALRRATVALRHRGPDNQAVWIDPAGCAGLAHTRLSLLDLSAKANQPLASVDGRLRLVHNGEFYDFEVLRRDCMARGHRFQTHSDSEILLPLYEESGAAALRSLRGEFAFILWDRNARRVFAARDRFGIKPLFYACHRGSLCFASEVKALFALGVPARWDMETVYLFHATRMLPPHRTLYQGVLQIPPGHFLLASAGDEFASTRLVSYWDFDYPPAEGAAQPQIDPAEAVVAVRERVQEAVRLRLRADVPVACYLSGGLDSGCVLGMAARQSASPIHAFSLSFPDDESYNETGTAGEMAESCGAVYHEVPVRGTDLADRFADAVWHAETPLLNAHGVAKFVLSRAVREAGFKAVLSGEGADEVFGGYIHFRKDVIGQQGADDFDAKLSRLAGTNAVSRHLLRTAPGDGSMAHIRRVLGSVPSYIEAYCGSGAQATALLRDELRVKFRGSGTWVHLLDEFDALRQLAERPALSQSMYLWSRTMLANYVLTVLGDRMEMGHSVEGRVPYLDHLLVEYVVRLPVGWKIRDDLTEKYILREAARPFITDTVYRKTKHPFMAPPAAARLDSPLYTFVQDLLRSAEFADNPIYDSSAVTRLLDRLPSMGLDERNAIDRELTSMVSFSLLHRMFGLAAEPGAAPDPPGM